jgi:phage-related minor tail protein
MTPLEKFRMQEARILELRKAGAFRSEEDFAKVYGALHEEHLRRSLQSVYDYLETTLRLKLQLAQIRENHEQELQIQRQLLVLEHRRKVALGEYTGSQIQLSEQVLAGQLAQLDSAQKKTEQTFRTLENAVKGFGDRFTDTFTEMVTTGKASFSDLANSIIQDLIRITMYTTVTKPLSNWLVGGITSLAGGLFGGSSWASAGIQQPGGLPQYATQKFAEGGWLMEPIIGMGLRTGTAYTLAERGPELVVPQGKAMGGQVNNVTVNVSVANTGARSEVSGVDAKGLGNAIKAAVLNVLAEQKRPGGMLNG